jgi:dCMP deaminase
MKPKYQQAHMRAAHLYAELSTARRLKVGALIVKDDRIISIGYNGTPSGWDNNCEYEQEDGTLKTKPEVLHAEMNAVSKLAKSGEGGDGASIFITHAPCIDCAKMIYQSGIKEVYYSTEYRDTSGVEFLKKCKVKVEQVNV